ncbi:hypothetical protein L1987_68894 [Smallanthus sonchifolius]|uniref:Uncharacterized protein n=1 Tax=Smallanthus sonchifolius TaxID=185202 RepID=A0ACB9B4H9_9ASTR|nr:hypothetical protein L1987_68894 [Smallanthus sonchifolius]
MVIYTKRGDCFTRRFLHHLQATCSRFFMWGLQILEDLTSSRGSIDRTTSSTLEGAHIIRVSVGDWAADVSQVHYHSGGLRINANLYQNGMLIVNFSWPKLETALLHKSPNRISYPASSGLQIPMELYDSSSSSTSSPITCSDRRCS